MPRKHRIEYKIRCENYPKCLSFVDRKKGRKYKCNDCANETQRQYKIMYMERKREEEKDCT